MSAATHPDVIQVGSTIAGHLEEIAGLFKPGVKLTLLARRPGREDGEQDMVLTNDTMDAAIRALEIRRAKDAPTPVPPPSADERTPDAGREGSPFGTSTVCDATVTVNGVTYPCPLPRGHDDAHAWSFPMGQEWCGECQSGVLLNGYCSQCDPIEYARESASPVSSPTPDAGREGTTTCAGCVEGSFNVGRHTCGLLPGAPEATSPVSSPSSPTTQRAIIERRLADIEARLAQGKGTWPKPDYVRDETWAHWQGEASALRGVLGDLDRGRGEEERLPVPQSALEATAQFAGLVAEAMGLDREGIEDAENWPHVNLLPLVHDMRIAAARWRWLRPRFSAHPGAGGTTHVEAWLPTTYIMLDHVERGLTVDSSVDRCMADERRATLSLEGSDE